MTASTQSPAGQAAATQTDPQTDPERADLLAGLSAARHFLRFTVRDLTDEQARQRTTASELTLGGLIKHVAAIEKGWADFILEGPSAMTVSEEQMAHYADGFRLLPAETLAGVLAGYAEVARRTDNLLASLPDLNLSHPLPPAPWFAPGEMRSARRVFLHIIAETAQHAGHADIIREALDGAKSMG
jgi:uncharacterized damage-inducible protein DinB